MRLTTYLSTLLPAGALASRTHSMLGQVSNIAFVPIAAGKFERFTELMVDTLDWIQKNEPETLQLEVYVLSQGSNGTEVSLFERYANAAAREAHLNSKHYAELFKTFQREDILAGTPQQYPGNYSQGFIKNNNCDW